MKKNVILTLVIILLTSQALAFEFCTDRQQNENNIRLISVDDMLKENAKLWTWQPLQKIELEIRVENKNNYEATYVLEVVFKDGEKTIEIAKDSDDLKKEFSLDANERKSVSLEFEISEEPDADTYDLYVKLYKKNNEDEECVENSEEKAKIEIIEICEGGKVDEDKLELSKIHDELEDNTEKWAWAPGNDVKISLNLENKDYSERDFTIELVFLDENNKEISFADNPDDIQKEISLDEDEKDDVKFNFKLKTGIDEAKYTLYAKAYDSDDEDICTSLKAESKSNPITISVEKEKRKVIVTKISGPKDIETSSPTQYIATLANLGSKDEDKVLAIAYNYQLGIKEKIEIENLNSGEEKTTTFNITIPNNISLTLPTYAILFSTEYEYNENYDYYKSASDEDDDIKYYVKVTQVNETLVPEITENETIENKTIESENETIIEEPEENATKIQTTTITGNAVGSSSESLNWGILLVFAALAGAGIFFFFKKPTRRKTTLKNDEPKVTRRYTARLN